MEVIKVDQERCVKCGACSEVCPVMLLKMEEGGPVAVHNSCIRCGHCVAVCPNEALNHLLAPLSNQVPVTLSVPTPEAMEHYLRFRRSIRSYREQKVSHDLMSKLLNISRFAPTGGNSQGLSYLVVDDGEKLKKITESVINWMEEEIKRGTANDDFYAGTVNIYRQTGYDIILRSAPNLVLALAARDNPFAYTSARYTLEYAEIYAPSLGLGTCWAGLLEASALGGNESLLELLDLAPEQAIVGAMLVGYPKYTYKRLVDRDPLQLKWL